MLLVSYIRWPAARALVRCRGVASVAPPPQLRVHSSLTGAKEPLPPLPEGQPHWGWYACGPTVYDDAHIGHARTYVCFDIIRRVLYLFLLLATSAMCVGHRSYTTLSTPFCRC
jgi:hypothetical protein